MATRTCALRIDPEDYEAHLRAAQAEGVSWAEWARQVLARAAGVEGAQLQAHGRPLSNPEIAVEQTPTGRFRVLLDDGTVWRTPSGKARTYSTPQSARRAYARATEDSEAA